MIKKSAFSMLELVFVIVVIGILSKFGVELMAGAYQNFLFTKINNKLQNQSATAVEFIAKRLSYRINDSVIAKKADDTFVGIQSIVPGDQYLVLEWVSRDIDGWRGNTQPFWSGIADLDVSSNAFINTPMTNDTNVTDLIKILSYGDSDISDAAIYFIGSNSDITTGYGWDGTAITAANRLSASMHPITGSAVNQLDGNFSDVTLYEYYQLAWSANAVYLEADGKGNNTYDLVFYYDYQPWNGEKYNDNGVKSSVIMQNVSTFQFRAVGSMVKIQVCVESNLAEEHSLCKEKTIF